MKIRVAMKKEPMYKQIVLIEAFSAFMAPRAMNMMAGGDIIPFRN